MFSHLSDRQARKLLQTSQVARLGCIVNGAPYITPINYDFEGDCVYGHSRAGMKISALRQNPQACIQVDQVESVMCWSSVLAFGDFEEIVEPAEREEILSRLLKRFPLLTPVEIAKAKSDCPPEVIVFRIRIDRITGVAEN
jgi:nitroimidazol reductase NimA-like FMN-containing flavoprotein (pyridoxamine 5'-phosphate oxidase superfamily)